MSMIIDRHHKCKPVNLKRTLAPIAAVICMMTPTVQLLLYDRYCFVISPIVNANRAADIQSDWSL